MVQDWVWEGLGLHLGRVLGRSGLSFGCSWVLMGRFFGVQNRALIKHWSETGSKRASGSILGRFWEGFERIWGGFGRVLGGFGPIVGGFLTAFGKVWARMWKDLK